MAFNGWHFLGLSGNDDQKKHLAGTLRAVGIGQFIFFVMRSLYGAIDFNIEKIGISIVFSTFIMFFFEIMSYELLEDQS